MWLLDVIPISRSPMKENTLTYFTTREVNVGMLVHVPLRKKLVNAMVIKIEKLVNKKASVKKQAFSLKKIEKIISEPFLDPAFYTFIQELSRYFLVPQSMLFWFFLPKAILERRNNPPHFLAHQQAEKNFKISYIQEDRLSRIKHYKGLIREVFAKGHSIFILTPTQTLAEATFSETRNGLEERSFLLHGGLTAKTLRETWEQIADSARPLLVVGTAISMAALRPDTRVFIVEEESSEHYYHSRERPFIDIRKTAEIFARIFNLHLVWGDTILRLGTLQETTYDTVTGNEARLLTPVRQKIIDATSQTPGGFRVLSDELKLYLKEILARKESIVLITHRRGHSPTTLCQDCGRLIVCRACSSPLTTHTEESYKKKSQFFCHHCLRKEDIPERCPYCKSWRLSAYGIGVEKVGAEFKQEFPDTTLLRIDRDSTPSKKAGEKIKQAFLSSPGNVLVTTELFLSFFSRPLPHIVVVSIDGLFSIPDYRMHERIMRLLIRLRCLAEKSFVIQTRLPAHSLFSHIVSGNISGFKAAELQERKRLAYPPAIDMIKITLEDSNRAKLLKKVAALTRVLQKWNPGDFPAFILKMKGVFRWHVVLKLEYGSWPHNHEKLLGILKNLPFSWKIYVDPPNLL